MSGSWIFYMLFFCFTIFHLFFIYFSNAPCWKAEFCTPYRTACSFLPPQHLPNEWILSGSWIFFSSFFLLYSICFTTFYFILYFSNATYWKADFCNPSRTKCSFELHQHLPNEWILSGYWIFFSSFCFLYFSLLVSFSLFF
jgi:hypothetical protein